MAVSSREIEEAAEYVRDLDDGEISGYATFRGIPDPMREAWENNPNNQRTMARVKERNADGRDERGVRASVLSLGACRDRQVSLDGAQNGLFTENLKARLSAGFRGSLQELGVEIARFTSRQGQDPTYDNFGEHNGSERERIFTI